MDAAEIRKVPSTIFQRIIYTAIAILFGYIALHFRDRLQDTISTPLWLLGALTLFSVLLFIISLILIARSVARPKWIRFTSATIDSTLWKWKWSDEVITDLKPFCETCGTELEIRNNCTGITYATPMFVTYCPVCDQRKIEYEGILDISEQARKKIIQIRDTDRWQMQG